MTISWTVLFLFLSNVLMGQNGDCLTAIQICKKDTLKIDSIKGFGLNNTEVGSSQATCFSVFQNISSIETNSLWIKW